jgi:3-deoxy-manno-octulosonate cytidylyltransferase (CMP-KDO synthetase)
MPKIVAIIPARYHSTRLPGKPLLKIGDQTMIQRVYNQAMKCSSLDYIAIATDNELIKRHVENFGGNVIMTSESHQSGTDRCAEALDYLKEKFDYAINIQGDEPFIMPEQIEILAKLLEGETQIATLVKIIEDSKTLFNANSPKVILNKNNEAIYFSRHTIPFFRDYEKDNWLNINTFYKHLGIYGYRTDVLKKITQLPQSTLELAEKLEQLRWIENGYKIKVAVSPYDSIGIDTEADVEEARKFII